jgi:hypothetical protein
MMTFGGPEGVMRERNLEVVIGGIVFRLGPKTAFEKSREVGHRSGTREAYLQASRPYA